MRHPMAEAAALLIAAALLLALPAFAQDDPEEEEMMQTGVSDAAGGSAGGADAAAPGAVDAYVSPIYEAVPEGRMEQVRRAAGSVAQAVQSSSSPVKARLACWLERIQDPQVDDRLVEWSRICPVFSNEGLLADQRCGTTSVQRDLMLDMLTDAGAVDEADRTLHVFARLRALVLVLGGRGANAVDTLEGFEFDARTAATELAKVQSDSRSRHYVALKDWIAAKRQDGTSLYNLCPLGG